MIDDDELIRKAMKKIFSDGRFINVREVEIIVRLNNIFDFANKFLCSNPAVKCDACCSGCAANNGYFQYKPASNTKVLEHEDISKLDIVKKCSELLKFPEALAQLEELKEDYEFNPNMGFLKDVGGCALPRNLRSVYCQITMCSFMKGAYCQEEILEIESLLRDLERIRIAEGRIF